MPIEIVPAGATGVVTEKHDGSKHPDRWDLATQAERNHAADTVQNTLTQQEVASGFAASLVDSAKNTAALSVQSQQETDQLSNQATNNANLGSVQAQNFFNLASVQATDYANSADVSRQKFAYEGQLQAQIIAAAAAAKAAECCCELKTAILADGQKTRDLLNSITEQNLRDRAQRSEAALAAYFAAKVAPTSPIS
jgi:hypothetical protein